MKKRRVKFSPEAKADLRALHDWIAEQAGFAVAAKYLRDLRKSCHSLEHASERGRRADEVYKGLRVIDHKNTNIAFVVKDDHVAIQRLFHGGQNWQDPAHWPGQ